MQHITHLSQNIIDLFEKESSRKRERKLVWVGARRNKSRNGDDKWYWRTHADQINTNKKQKTIENPPWGLGEPNSLGNCVAVDSALQWKWNSVACAISGYVICQKNEVLRWG